MLTKVSIPHRQRTFAATGDNYYHLETMPSHHLPPLTSQTVGGGAHLASGGVKVQQLFADSERHDHHHPSEKKREGNQNSNENHALSLFQHFFKQ